jgi:galactofuranosylgalactofuranosylrhamnosyl-N-acetylglucosaminyl-diphospho-decaprenol beta-1,5/1,6-galactofuranosyltransferase
VGEVVDRDKFFWRAAPHTTYGHDFSQESLRESPDLHRRIDVDYTGWWMCLVPREALEQVGLALPLFIKWDDAEYGLRAGENGIPTVTLPGMAVWHLSWSDKDDTSGWQAYFHVRNRLIAAALHSPHERGGTLLRDTFKFDLKFLIMMQYGNTALHHRAYEDFLAGPSRLFQNLPTALPSVLRQLKDFPDGTVLSSSADVAPAQLGALRAEPLLTPPVRLPAIAITLVKGLVHNMRQPDPEARERPQMNVSAQDARWFLLSRLDSATVATADGRGVTMRYRDRQLFLRLLWRSIRLHRRLHRSFPALQREYRAALQDLTSPRAWSAMWNVVAEVDDRPGGTRPRAAAARLFRSGARR